MYSGTVSRIIHGKKVAKLDRIADELLLEKLKLGIE